ncbi:hypothetical protein EXIGLDRAFT_737310 [Exidia glandulosa HHB12029]|uniref:Uncharacterized protein n=1 Tax=Exidia glandulosa HHB12029 TaxID=1314781 RepID=A0A165J0Z6_EXIGL|nr:hypothetical protein EXIGLDRAFT_737310 [Exidia glandulosa HHB12029]
MDPHEAPTFQDWPVAPVDGEFKYGQVVLLSLDPVASVSPFEDEVATAAAAQLQRAVYLAVILEGGDSFLMNAEEKYLLNFHFLLVGEGLAEENPSASTPLAPALVHPDGRAPVSPSAGSLPRPNLYVHSYDDFLGLVSRMHRGINPCSIRFSEDDMRILRVHVFKDKVKAQKERIAALEARIAAGETDVEYTPIPAYNPAEHESSRLSAASSGLFGMDPDAQERNQLPDPERDFEMRLAQAQIRVEVWLDVAAYPGPYTIEQPFHLHLEVDRLKRVWNEWEERATAELMAKRPATTAWLDGMAHHPDADSTHSNMDVESAHSTALPLQPDLPASRASSPSSLAPDDAIDVRMEQEEQDRRLVKQMLAARARETAAKQLSSGPAGTSPSLHAPAAASAGAQEGLAASPATPRKRPFAFISRAATSATSAVVSRVKPIFSGKPGTIKA